MTSNTDLQERVLRALEFEPAVDATALDARAEDGLVTLRGAVKTYFEKTRAERAVAHVFGVRAVANDIDVLPTYQQRLGDAAIAEAVVHAIDGDTAIPAGAVHATVQNGWVTLDGRVDWQYQRDAADDALRHLYGVRGITNAIVLRARPGAANITARIEGALKRSAEIDSRTVHVEETPNGQVRLTGTVRSLSEREAAEQAAWSVPGVRYVSDRLAVTP